MSFISYSHQNLPSKLHLLRREALRPDHRIMDITSWGRCSNCRSTGRVISCQSGTMGVLGVTWSHLEFFGIDGTWAMRNRPEIPIPLYCLVFGVVPMCSRASYRNQSRNVFWMAHFIGKMAVMSLFHITQHGWSLVMAYCCGFPSFLGINPVEKEVSHLFPWFDYDFVLTCLLDHEPGIVLKCLSKHFEIHTSWLVLDNLSAESVLAGYHPFPLARWGWIDKWRRHARKHKERDKCKSSVTHIHTGVTGAYRIVSACK